ncbi:LOW QUALITY PROTEIN: NXPE family member 3-like [Amphiura filiformis]|uniref:LOW QUALITY PROTEIN: NXPE family member 3-like n=1 Tax=Amphiura filiformis TaxID=82378 RepID=UPI003B221BBA
MTKHETVHLDTSRSAAVPKDFKSKSLCMLTLLMVTSYALLWLTGTPNMTMPPRLPNIKASFLTHPLNITTTDMSYTSDHTTAAQSTTKHAKEQLTSFEQATDPSTSFYIIVNYKENYTLCDVIEITIQLRIVDNQTKSHGGDFIWVWVYDATQRASSTADAIIDNHDGTITAKVTLRWTGQTMVGVSLVHSREIVSRLRHFRETYPARYSYRGNFTGPTQNKTVQQSCHVSQEMYVPIQERYRNMKFCDYSDPKTGFPWFCVKPQEVGCEKYIRHYADRGSAIGYTSADFVKNYLRPSSITPLYMSHADFMVEPDFGETNMTSATCLSSNERPLCTSELPSRQSQYTPGFYHQDTWTSHICKNRHFTSSDVIECLQNQTIHFIGDSTLRQWYEYLARYVLKDVQETIGPHEKFGPHVAIEKANNISIYFNFHGYPIALRDIEVKQIHYVSEQLDSLTNLDNTIICLCLWAHFTATNLRYYRDRLQSIKDSIVRLRQRNPNVRVLIKSANTRAHPPNFDRSNWYAWEIHKVMKQFFSGFPGVTVIDVWDMTIGHRTGYDLHPAIEIISQEMDMFLSFLCPVE